MSEKNIYGQYLLTFNNNLCPTYVEKTTTSLVKAFKNKFNLKIISIDVISETINEHYIPKFYIYFEFNYSGLNLAAFGKTGGKLEYYKEQTYKSYFDNYKELFSLMDSLVEGPDLLIYLRASVSTLVEQIQKRGRDYENTIRIDYLERLNKHYEDWIDRYPHPKLIIETDDLDFVNQPEDLGVILDLIDKRLFSLFP